MTNEEMIENLKCVIADISVQCEHLKAENAVLRERLDKAVDKTIVSEMLANERGWYIYPQDETCLLCDEIAHYGKGKPLYGWHITAPKLFDKPRELSEFGITRAPMSWCYVEQAP